MQLSTVCFFWDWVYTLILSFEEINSLGVLSEARRFGWLMDSTSLSQWDLNPRPWNSMVIGSVSESVGFGPRTLEFQGHNSKVIGSVSESVGFESRTLEFQGPWFESYWSVPFISRPNGLGSESREFISSNLHNRNEDLRHNTLISLPISDLCDNIWGPQYTYTLDSEPCIVMEFTGKNPNTHGNMETTDGAQIITANSMITTYLSLYFFSRSL